MDRFDAMATLIAAVDGGSLSAASRALGTPLAGDEVSIVMRLLRDADSSRHG